MDPKGRPGAVLIRPEDVLPVAGQLLSRLLHPCLIAVVLRLIECFDRLLIARQAVRLDVERYPDYTVIVRGDDLILPCLPDELNGRFACPGALSPEGAPID